MSESPAPLDDALFIDELCAEYEGELRREGSPNVTSLLERASTEQRDALLYELARVYLDWRSSCGEDPDLPALQSDLGVSSRQISVAFGDFTAQNAAAQSPRRFEFYTLRGQLGSGGMSTVFRARDERLKRDVALKVLSPKHSSARTLAEARLAAGLDHPNIVPVYDVGSAPDGCGFIASKLIEGQDLAELLARGALPLEDVIRVVLQVCDALAFAHSKGLVHRDVKPHNILVEANLHAWLTDFGLARMGRDEDQEGKLVGTPAYMSPEQARRESHRVDARSDVFGVGVLLYELLTRQRPFQGETRAELLEAVTSADPTAISELSPGIPKELERVIERAMAKRSVDRYPSVTMLREDIAASVEGTGIRSDYRVGRRLTVAPKGLKSYDASDAEFYVSLLPGPRDRYGVPTSIRNLLSILDPEPGESPTPVCVLYGPSGSGKSSLVQAGVLPRLSDRVRATYVECTSNAEEQLYAKLSEFSPPRRTLDCQVAALRESQRTTKHVLVLDQFEQWLHQDPALGPSRMLDALRHCDGERIQALIVVRDDYWVSVGRLMHFLEIPIEEGRSGVFVDLFTDAHAQHVLSVFGHVAGALGRPTQLTEREVDFVQAAVRGVSKDGHVVPTQLAILVQMLSGRLWNREELDGAGGARGLGVRFLDRMLSSTSPCLAIRPHVELARRLLVELLPLAGKSIRDQPRRLEEIEAAGIDRSQVEETLRILASSECRLVSTVVGDDDGVARYQLTHDQLVPIIRRWYTATDRQSLRGRARIELRRQASVWSEVQDSRLLPSAARWIQLQLLTSAQSRTAAEAELLEEARKRHVPRIGVVIALFALLLLGGWVWQRSETQAKRRFEVGAILQRYWVAEETHLPLLIDELRAHPQLALELVEEHREKTIRTKALEYALGDESPSDLLQPLLTESLDLTLALAEILRPDASELQSALWHEIERPYADVERALRAGIALARWDTNGDPRWETAGPILAGQIVESVEKNPSRTGLVVQSLAPVSLHLLPELCDLYRRSELSPARRATATGIIGDYAANDPELLALLLSTVDMQSFDGVLQRGAKHGRSFNATLRSRREQMLESERGPIRDEALARLEVALLRLGEPEFAWSTLADPTEVRAQLIVLCAPGGVPPHLLHTRLASAESDVEISGLLFALGQFSGPQWETTCEAIRPIVDRLAVPIAQSRELRSALVWFQRRTHHPGYRMPPKKCPLTESTLEKGHWMIPLPAQGGEVGSSSPDRQADEPRRAITLPQRVAIASTETTLAQYRRFDPNFDHGQMKRSPTNDSPVLRVTWNDAARYCNWLSAQAGIPESEWCYRPRGERMMAVESATERRGFRLPTEEEWEIACRAGSSGERYFGDSPRILGAFAWYKDNSMGIAHPVARRIPNAWGFFDLLGNVSEWCHNPYQEHPTSEPDGRYALRGGSFYDQTTLIRAADRSPQSPDYLSESVGFRVARTVAAPAGTK